MDGLRLPRKPEHVTVIGAGAMGCDIAAIFVAAGCDVHLIAPTVAKHAGQIAHVRRSVSQIGQTGTRVGRLEVVQALADAPWQRTRLAVETVPERLDLKRKVFAELLALAPADVPVVSNASGFPITAIAGHLASAHRTAGLHFFLPAHLVPVVEVVKGEKTAQVTVELVHEYMRAVHRVPVRVNRDSPGFLANRLQHALMREAFAVVEEGLATPEDVDAAVKYGFGFRYVAAGPLLQKEFAGLDTQLAAATTIYPGLSTSDRPSPVLSDLVAQGRLGIKAMHGFWDWTPEAVHTARADYEETLLQALKLLKISEASPIKRPK